VGIVSIQLMSPASGDLGWRVHAIAFSRQRVSIQLMSPASGDLDMQGGLSHLNVSIQLMSPASGDYNSKQAETQLRKLFVFPFN
jgi:hypothetical protein